MCILDAGFDPPPYAEQSPSYPAAHGGCIRQTLWILAVRRCLLQRFADTDPLTCLLPTTQRVGSARNQPVGQDCEGRTARSTDSTSHPNPLALLIVGGSKPPSMADDRLLSTQRALPWYGSQRNYPGSSLSFPSGSAIKRIKAGVKALFADSSCQDSFCQPAPSPSGQVSFKRKRIPLCLAPRQPLT